jgi:uncharacterized delta-60 repeat protein
MSLVFGQECRMRFSKLSVLVSVCVLLLCLLPTSVGAAPGQLDPTYGLGGKVTTRAFGVSGDAAVQVDGKVVIAGDNVSRLKLNGDFDPNFGTGGTVGAGLFTNALVIQPNGKIVLTGWKTISGISSFAITRLNGNGSTDSQFGGGTVVTIRFLPFNSNDRIQDVALQPDGKIVVAGEVDSNRLFAIARFNEDGSLDTTFGNGGKVTVDMGLHYENAEAVVIQPNLKIVVAGTVAESIDPHANNNFGLLRLNSDGQLDETFGVDGIVYTDLAGDYDFANTLAIQPDGKLIAAGYAYRVDAQRAHFALVRYYPDGSLDAGFGDTGIALTDFSNGAALRDIVLQSDGRIIAAGHGNVLNPQSGNDFVVIRYNANGRVDTSFGNLGTVITDFGTAYDISTAIVLQPDGKVVVAGQYLARYLTAETKAPVLQTQANSNRALAFDSVTFVGDPFPITNEHNFSADKRTRVMMFVTNLTLSSGESFSAVTVQAQNAAGGVYQLPVEFVGEVPGLEWLTQVVIKLPDVLANAGDIRVTLTLHHETSNQGVINIK